MRNFIVGLCLSLFPLIAQAFCGFYAGSATSKLYNNATQVVLLRSGTRTVLSMQNNYQGPPESFAMVVPVPVVLQQENVKTLTPDLFDKIDTLSAPRLVEYWEQDPCSGILGVINQGGSAPFASVFARDDASPGLPSDVVVESKFTVAEYDVVVLSAAESTSLETWLNMQKYNIPEGSAPYLKPYIEQGFKFFVAKVDISKVKYDASGKTMLSPLRFFYDSETFSLPVRLGLINSNGTQDLIVHIVANKRYETANYKNVFIPTNVELAESVKDKFSSFYATLFDATLEKNKDAAGRNPVVTEYSWLTNFCDPCTGPTLDPVDLMSLGLDALPKNAGTVRKSGCPDCAPIIRGSVKKVSGSIEGKIVSWIVQRDMFLFRYCYEQALLTSPGLSGEVPVTFTINPDAHVSSVSTPGKLDPGLETCVRNKMSRLSFTVPTDNKPADVVYSFDFFEGIDGALPDFGQWTLTRLHTRYGSDSLGEDIIFKAVESMAGGREIGLNRTGAYSYGRNEFQGRYIIRHPWKGEIECREPERGIWGGPPNGEKSIFATEDLAFAERGVSLSRAVLEDIPSLGIKASSNKPRLLIAKRLTTVDRQPSSLPSQSPEPKSVEISWGFLVALLGGVLLLITVWFSRPKNG